MSESELEKAYKGWFEQEYAKHEDEDRTPIGKWSEHWLPDEMAPEECFKTGALKVLEWAEEWCERNPPDHREEFGETYNANELLRELKKRCGR